jgi:hypothetical protein
MVEGTTESQTAPPRKKGGIKLLFAFGVVLALLMIIVYLLSVMHAKKYYLVPDGNTLIVKKGIMFLFGSLVYKPTNPSQAMLYEAVELRSDQLPLETQEFDDLPSLNQAYAAILIDAANKLVRAEDDRSFQEGKALFERAKHLEGLNLKQINDIDADVTEIEYVEAKRTYNELESILNDARARFKKAETAGQGRYSDASDWVRKIDDLLEVVRANKTTALSPTKQASTTP